MIPPTAIVTGASSGIGLALAKTLVERGFKVVIADLREPKDEVDGTLFVKTDVSSWDQLAAMFKKAYDWQTRLDLCALNAGVDDRDDIFHTISSDSARPPKRPNMLTFGVNLNAVYYGIKLAAHYMSLPSSQGGKPSSGGKIVVTSSGAGFFPTPVLPQYAATKHGLIGLVRSLAPVSAPVNIRINAVCPYMVAATGLAPPGSMDGFGDDKTTPMSTIMRCFSEVLDLDNVSSPNWINGGKNGETVEGRMQELIYHQPTGAPPMDESDMKAWMHLGQTYIKQNIKYTV